MRATVTEHTSSKAYDDQGPERYPEFRRFRASTISCPISTIAYHIEQQHLHMTTCRQSAISQTRTLISMLLHTCFVSCDSIVRYIHFLHCGLSSHVSGKVCHIPNFLLSDHHICSVLTCWLHRSELACVSLHPCFRELR